MKNVCEKVKRGGIAVSTIFTYDGALLGDVGSPLGGAEGASLAAEGAPLGAPLGSADGAKLGPAGADDGAEVILEHP